MSLRGRLLRALHLKHPLLEGNQIDLLCNGAEYFPALLDAISQAQQSIRLETYLYADDAMGDAVTAALCHAAIRGVDVRVVVDGFGARNLDQRHRPQLEAAGVQVRIFRPEHRLLQHLLARQRARLRRMHRKLVLIDGSVAFAGGINIIDDATDNPAPIRMDFAVRIAGPLIGPIAQAIDHQWLMLTRLDWLLHNKRPARTALDLSPKGSLSAALVLRDNLFHRRSIESAYVYAIRQARSEIVLAMSYFIPSRRLRKALLAAATRGVRIQLLLQGRIEYRLQHYAAQALYAELLNHGIEIFEYQPGFLHAKAAVIDQDWSTIGSANLDPFSLLVAREANMVIRDQGFTQQLRQRLMTEIQTSSHQITREAWAASPRRHQLLRTLSARLLYRLLSLTGYGNNY